MFSAILLVCTIDYSECQSHINSMVFETENECHNALAEGYDYYESNGYVVEGYYCHKWFTSAFDEKI